MSDSKVLKKLVCKNGTYQLNGETKTRWVKIGTLCSNQHGQYLAIDRHVNLAGLATKDGETRVFVSFFDPDPPRATEAANPVATDSPVE